MRVFAFAAALFTLPIVALVMLALVLLIWFQEGRPAIFTQVRMGKNQRPFTLYKLRTMPLGTAQQATHLVDQNKVTRLGRLLRKTKLDELPQLINVVRGQMTFVGPRPCLANQIELRNARTERDVFDALPGITGLAQVCGIDMSVPERLSQVDALYLAKRSFLFDCRLLLATVGIGRKSIITWLAGQDTRVQD